ncbi:MAG TPA: hypothetical protein DCO79_09740 [Spirochaeta sp.]|nr:hypothetical protein [Spirochaeta sp.]
MKNIYEEEKFLKGLVKALAAQFGPSCEVLLHDLKDQPYDHTIVAIENGQITGRKVNDCGTNLGLEVLRGTNVEGDKYNYFTQTKDGKMLRSTTIYIRDDDDEVIGCLCINMDITDFIMASKTIATITQRQNDEFNSEETVEEDFTGDINELLDDMIQRSIEHAGKPVALMTKADKIEGIRYLDEKGALLIQKSGDKIARFYDISKYTLYSYLEEIRNGDDNGKSK